MDAQARGQAVTREMEVPWRTRVGVIALVYVAYYAAALVGAVIAATGDDARPSLIITIVVSSLHFTTAFFGMLIGDRTALRGGVLTVTVLADWGYAFSLGLATTVISRDSAQDEKQVAIIACSLLATATMGCFYKSYHFLNPDAYDQTTGDEIDVL